MHTFMDITFKHITMLFLSMTGCRNFQKKLNVMSFLKRNLRLLYMYFVYNYCRIENMCYDWIIKILVLDFKVYFVIFMERFINLMSVRKKSSALLPENGTTVMCFFSLY